MAEKIDQYDAGKADKRPPIWKLLLPLRFLLFYFDYLMLRQPHTKRYRELSYEHLICRFCGHPIDLLNAWRCACGCNRPGNYFGRCPKCLAHPSYLDCPACGFTMDVR